MPHPQVSNTYWTSLHFADDETEAQRGSVTGPGPPAGHQQTQHLNTGTLFQPAWRTAPLSGPALQQVPSAREPDGRRLAGVRKQISGPLDAAEAWGRIRNHGQGERQGREKAGCGVQFWPREEQVTPRLSWARPSPGLTLVHTIAVSCDERSRGPRAQPGHQGALPGGGDGWNALQG